MSRYNTTLLKAKISPRDKEGRENSAIDRFKNADETLGVASESIKNVTKSHTKVVRKTFSIPEKEIHLFEQIQDKALNKKVVLGESEVLRLGLLIVSELSDEELSLSARRLEKIPTGRPTKKHKDK
jgi:hypothetical protein